MAVSQTVQHTLSNLIFDIEKQIDVIRAEANFRGVPVEEMKHVDGKWVMPELLLAQSQAILALVTLESSGKRNG